VLLLVQPEFFMLILLVLVYLSLTLPLLYSSLSFSGRIVTDSDYFHNKKHIWPEGYTAFRKFRSVKDPHVVILYKMEVLRNSDIKARPLFRVTSEDGTQVSSLTILLIFFYH
jgi:hypothetical protein